MYKDLIIKVLFSFHSRSKFSKECFLYLSSILPFNIKGLLKIQNSLAFTSEGLTSLVDNDLSSSSEPSFSVWDTNTSIILVYLRKIIMNILLEVF